MADDSKQSITQVLIQTPNNIILSSGSVIITNDDNYVEFLIDKLKFRFSFPEDSQKNNLLEGKVEEYNGEQYYSIKAYNMKNADNSSFAKPINVAKIRGKKLSVIFSITSLNSDDYSHKILTYTWLLEK